MSVHAPPTSSPAPPVSAARPAETRRASAPRPVFVIIGVVALWAALASGLAQVSHHVFGMTVEDGWAFAIGITLYIYLFVGFVIGLVYLVNQDRG